MFASKLTITKETQEQQAKSMSVRQKGRIMFARLKELEADGTLMKAKTRADVARLVGYPEERAKAGYSWVSNLIVRGHLSETIREWTPSGKMMAEYHTTDTMPDYGYEEVNRRKNKKKRGQQTAKAEKQALEAWQKIKNEAPVLDYDTTPQVIERARVSNPIKIEITRGDTTIKVEIDDYEQASKLITTILKGE